MITAMPAIVSTMIRTIQDSPLVSVSVTIVLGIGGHIGDGVIGITILSSTTPGHGVRIHRFMNRGIGIRITGPITVPIMGRGMEDTT